MRNTASLLLSQHNWNADRLSSGAIQVGLDMAKICLERDPASFCKGIFLGKPLVYQLNFSSFEVVESSQNKTYPEVSRAVWNSGDGEVTENLFAEKCREFFHKKNAIVENCNLDLNNHFRICSSAKRLYHRLIVYRH